MMKIKYLLAAVIGSIVLGCDSENPFLSKEQAEAILKLSEKKPVEFVAAIVNENVYWIRNFDSEPRKLNSNIPGGKRTLRASHDHSKMAFITSSNNIAIMDTLGTAFAVSGLGTVIDMDWSQDDKTLWLLVDDEIKFYGPALTVPELEKDFQEEVISAAVTANRDVFYIVRRPTASGYTERLEFRGRNGASRTISKKSGETYHMASVRLSKDKEHFVLGYNLAQGYEELEKLEFYELNASFPDFTYESSQSYAEAIYDAESAFMVTVTSEFGDAFYLAAEYTLNELGEEDFSKYKYDYSGEIGSVFIDWK